MYVMTTMSQDPNPHIFPRMDEIPDRLNEQHVVTTDTFGFLIHPNIPLTSPSLKIADVGTGTGIWLLDVAKVLPPTYQLTGFDCSSSAFPPSETLPPNISFRTQDMLLAFPESEQGTYDVVAVRFVSAATSRREWSSALTNLMTLLKPGGWLQWIDSCNFTLYNTIAGTSRKACQEMYDGLEPFRMKKNLVIGMMIRDPGNLRREDVFKEMGMSDVQEDMFSTDKLLLANSRKIATRNMIECFKQYLVDLVDIEGSGWTQERVERVYEKALKEVAEGVYHTLNHICIVGKKI